MKKHSSFRLVFVTLAGALLVPAFSAFATPPANTARFSLNPMRARDAMYGDVLSTDGKRVGDVFDYVLQFSKLPQLCYVIVKSGGVLGMGGDLRAVPADALALFDDRFHVSLTRAAFESLPVLPEHHRSFLNDAANLVDLAKRCNTPADHATLNGDYVLFSSLNDEDIVVGANDENLGRFTDLWIDFNANEAPYLEFQPTDEGLANRGPYVRYELPTTKFVRARNDEIYFSVSEHEIEQSKLVDDVTAYVAKAGEKLEIIQTNGSR